jgi:hypothetical protein
VDSGNGKAPRKERSSLQELATELPPPVQRRGQGAERRDAAVAGWIPAKGSSAAVVWWRPA